MKIHVTVNDSKRTLEQGTVLTQLLAELQMGDRPVAVERNFEIVSQAEFGGCEIVDGDVLEIVTLVGGG